MSEDAAKANIRIIIKQTDASNVRVLEGLLEEELHG